MSKSSPVNPGSVTMTINGTTVTAFMVSAQQEAGEAFGSGFTNIRLEIRVEAEDAAALFRAIVNPPPHPPPKKVRGAPSPPHPVECECETCRAELEDGDL